MATKVYLGCPKRVKRLRCDKPLTLLRIRGDEVELICPSGHRVIYTLRYFQRFLRSLHKGQMIKIPDKCPVCSTVARPGCAQAETGLIQCGSCGTYLVYNRESKMWEVAETS